MLLQKYRLPVLLLFLTFLFCSSSGFSQQLSLKVAGDETAGYRVDIYNGSQLVVTNTEEFSLQMFNLDLSTVAELPHWTGQKWNGNEKSITLTRDTYLKDFDANLLVLITYEVVNANIIKKTVELFQPSMA